MARTISVKAREGLEIPIGDFLAGAFARAFTAYRLKPDRSQNFCRSVLPSPFDHTCPRGPVSTIDEIYEIAARLLLLSPEVITRNREHMAAIFAARADPDFFRLVLEALWWLDRGEGEPLLAALWPASPPPRPCQEGDARDVVSPRELRDGVSPRELRDGVSPRELRDGILGPAPSRAQDCQTPAHPSPGEFGQLRALLRSLSAPPDAVETRRPLRGERQILDEEQSSVAACVWHGLASAVEHGNVPLVRYLRNVCTSRIDLPRSLDPTTRDSLLFCRGVPPLFHHIPRALNFVEPAISALEAGPEVFFALVGDGHWLMRSLSYPRTALGSGFGLPQPPNDPDLIYVLLIEAMKRVKVGTADMSGFDVIRYIFSQLPETFDPPVEAQIAGQVGLLASNIVVAPFQHNTVKFGPRVFKNFLEALVHAIRFSTASVVRLFADRIPAQLRPDAGNFVRKFYEQLIAGKYRRDQLIENAFKELPQKAAKELRRRNFAETALDLFECGLLPLEVLDRMKERFAPADLLRLAVLRWPEVVAAEGPPRCARCARCARCTVNSAQYASCKCRGGILNCARTAFLERAGHFAGSSLVESYVRPGNLGYWRAIGEQ